MATSPSYHTTTATPQTTGTRTLTPLSVRIYADCSTASLSRYVSQCGSGCLANQEQDAKDTPREMIVHESIKGLLDEVKELKARCNGLESVNAELKSEMGVLKGYYAADHARISTNGNLTSYAFSSTSSDDGTQRTGADAKLATKMANLEADMIKKFRAVGELFEDLQQRLNTEIAARKAETVTLQSLQKEIEQMKLSATAVKGFVRSLEMKLKPIGDGYGLDRLDETEDAYFTDTRSSTSTSEMTSYFTDKLEQMQAQLNMSAMNCDNICNELAEKVDALRAAVESGGTQVAASNVQYNAAENRVPKASQVKCSVSLAGISTLL